MAGYIGRIDPFDDTVEDWPSYTERLEQYFEANEVADEKRVPALLSLIGGKTYGLLRSLTAPDKPKDKDYDELVQILENHLAPKPSIIAERFRFHKREQREGESVSTYVAELKKLSQNCEFGETLSDVIRDRLVCGLRSENIQKRLLSEHELVLNRAVEIAIAMETAAKDAVELRNSKGQGVHKVYRQYDSREPDRNNAKPKGNFSGGRDSLCYRCGGQHSPHACRYRDFTCRYCHVKGHLEKRCKVKWREQQKKRGVKNSKSLHAVDDNSPNDSDGHTDESYCDSDHDELLLGSIELNEVKYTPNADVIWLKPRVAGRVVTMELDTGSAVSILPTKMYRELFPNINLQKTTVMLKTYTGERLRPQGKIHVKVEHNGVTSNLDLYVVDSTGPALFGRDWLKQIKLDWREIKSLKVTPVTESTNVRLQNLLSEYSDVFSDELGLLKGTKAKLVFKDDTKPVFMKARQVPYSLRPAVETELDRLEKSGVLRKVETSEWATPIVPVVKRSGAVRICGDYKVTVNPALQVDQYPLPKIEDIFAKLAGGKRFTKIDLRQAYTQMEMEEEFKPCLTINTHKGLYEQNRLVFGIASAPAIWQRTMDQILAGVPKTECIIDDMIITGENDNEHLVNLELVLKRLKEHNLKASLDKCEFFQEKITYCGHDITAEGLQKTPEKVQAVLGAPRPENVSQLRSFLGLVNYYHKFLPDLSTELYPLNNLLQKDVKWQWTTSCEAAFNKAKELITSDTVLTHYDPNKPLKLASDASPYGIGCVLSQIMEDGLERPIAFASRTLSKSERNYSQIDKEALALIWGVKKFHHYVYGQKFTLVTDHQPLLSILHPHKGIPAMTAARLQRYALFLSGHNYDIVYRNTTKHCNADALSRLPLDIDKSEAGLDASDLFHISQMERLPVTCDEIRKATQRDPTLSRVLECVLKGWTNDSKEYQTYYNRRDELSSHSGCLLWGMRVIIPEPLRQRVLDQLHEGHLGIVKMKSLARSYVWWPSIDQAIEQIAKSCSGCQQNQNMPQHAPLHPWEWPSSPWQRIHVDFAGPFQGHMFFVVVDAHSKWPETVIMKSITSTQTIQVLREIFSRNGLPEQLVSDNGPQFISEEFQAFMRQNGIKHFRPAPYHPASNGLAERYVQTLKQGFRSMEKGEMPEKKLTNFLLAYRNAPHMTTGESPAVLFLGRPLRCRLDILKPDIRQRVSNKMFAKAFGKPTGKPRSFHVGKKVLVRDYRPNKKWTPGIVHKCLGPLNYEVKVGPDMIWKRHIDQLLDSLFDVNTQPCDSSLPIVPIPSDVTLYRPIISATSSRSVKPKCVSTSALSGSEKPAERRYPERVRKPPKRLDL